MFTPDKFLKVLPIIGKAYLGIFIVTGIIVLIVYLLSRFTDKKPNDEEK